MNAKGNCKGNKLQAKVAKMTNRKKANELIEGYYTK